MIVNVEDGLRFFISLEGVLSCLLSEESKDFCCWYCTLYISYKNQSTSFYNHFEKHRLNWVEFISVIMRWWTDVQLHFWSAKAMRDRSCVPQARLFFRRSYKLIYGSQCFDNAHWSEELWRLRSPPVWTRTINLLADGFSIEKLPSFELLLQYLQFLNCWCVSFRRQEHAKSEATLSKTTWNQKKKSKQEDDDPYLLQIGSRSATLSCLVCVGFAWPRTKAVRLSSGCLCSRSGFR